jgi:hypothetical protein
MYGKKVEPHCCGSNQTSKLWYYILVRRDVSITVLKVSLMSTQKNDLSQLKMEPLSIRSYLFE